MRRTSGVGLALVTALGLCVAAGYDRMTRAEWVTPGETVSAPKTLDVGEIAVGVEIELAVPLFNNSDDVKEAYGFAPVCNETACYSSKVVGERCALPPGQAVRCVCYFKVVSAGPFRVPVRLIVNDGGVRTVEVVVTGVALEGLPNVFPGPHPTR